MPLRENCDFVSRLNKRIHRAQKNTGFAHFLAEKGKNFYEVLAKEGCWSIDLEVVHKIFNEMQASRKAMDEQYDVRSNMWVIPPNTTGCVLCKMHGPALGIDFGCVHMDYYSMLAKQGRRAERKNRKKLNTPLRPYRHG